MSFGIVIPVGGHALTQISIDDRAFAEFSSVEIGISATNIPDATLPLPEVAPILVIGPQSTLSYTVRTDNNTGTWMIGRLESLMTAPEPTTLSAMALVACFVVLRRGGFAAICMSTIFGLRASLQAAWHVARAGRWRLD